MATTANIKNGSVIFYKNKRMKVIEFQHVKPGKGGAFVRTKLKDIQSGKIIDETFNSGHKLKFIKVEAKQLQYLYRDDDFFIFMENDSFEQLNASKDIIGEQKSFFDGTDILDIRLPSHVNLKVSDTEPGFKGNTATGATKPATLETGYTLNVPLFINEGDLLKIDTRTGEYVERCKK